MISCLMVTLDRLALARLAIRSYAEQTYPGRELVIVTNGTESYRSALADYAGELGIAGVHVLYPGSGGLTLGALRNISLESARSEIICQWDDDDYSHPGIGHPSPPHDCRGRGRILLYRSSPVHRAGRIPLMD